MRVADMEGNGCERDGYGDLRAVAAADMDGDLG
jgi:hypothetical protein